MRLVLLALALAACGPDAHSREVCRKAADRWSTCAAEMLGPEMAARQKTDIDACAKDSATVRMYEKCLKTATCEEMLDCMMDEAMK